MNELTSSVRKIMEVIRYFRVGKNEYLATKLFLSKRYLWRDIEEEEFNEAVEQLIDWVI